MGFLVSLKRRTARLKERISGLCYGHMRPRAIVIGSQKCGTTALYKYLALHPQVVPSVKKELHFFNNDAHYAQGTDFYLRHFQAATPERQNKVAIDISPGYLQPAHKTAQRIFDFDAHIPLIAVLRDPVYRAYSAWQMYRRFYARNPDWFFKWYAGYDTGKDPYQQFVKRKSFGDCFYDDIKVELELLSAHQTPEMNVLDHGLYAEQLVFFFALFKKQQLLILGSEDMLADTPRALNIIESHISISHHNWSTTDTMPHFQGNYDEQPTQAEIELLRTFYKPHNRRLFDLLGREFNWL